MDESFEQFRKKIADAARLTFTVYRQQHPDEQFCTYALYSDSDGGGPNPAACTEQLLNRIAQGYVNHGLAPDPGYLRYTPDEWKYCGAEGSVDEWEKVWVMNEVLRADKTASLLTYKPSAFQASILALRDLDSEGFFGSGEQREKITLLIWITDSFEAEEWWIRSVQDLNPPTVYNRFMSETKLAREEMRKRREWRPPSPYTETR